MTRQAGLQLSLLTEVSCKPILDKLTEQVMVLRMAAATLLGRSEDATETRRRSLLAESDVLLDDVETLRLHDRTDTPERLREAIRALQIRLGRRNPPIPPATLHAAHDLVFAVQQRLMAANPNHPRPNRHVGRPSGQPAVTVVRDDRVWKVLTLPSPPNGVADAEWLELVDCTVERAWDRWCYAQHHAVRAAREHFKADVAVAVVRAAWGNYWELLKESELIRARLLRLRPARSRGAPHM
jgi:hypothetical protein